MPHPAVPRWSIAIHGGASGATRPMSPELEDAYRTALTAALEAGGAVLAADGSALDAAQAAVRTMEDDPLFNAGRGSVIAADGRIEMDASIMDGANLKAGAVAGVGRIRNPIEAARAVMDASPHVLLIGDGAETFAAGQGIAMVNPAWFHTEARWADLERLLAKRGQPIPPRPAGTTTTDAVSDPQPHRFGTVGAVALDRGGHLAAATSTGGQTGKTAGRVGDTPIIGAGTYARDDVCAVSGTGTGEYFIRLALAHEIDALVRHRGLSLRAAIDQLIHGDLAAIGGDGGVVAIAPDGGAAFAFNSTSMSRGRLAEGGAAVVALWPDEAL
jgi:beta-aspartyl-peptidase (threonine type)